MNILTFDIEDWIIYKRYSLGSEKQIDAILEDIFEILGEKNLKATFFCLGALAREYPDIIKRISRNNYQIGCHSDQHKWLTSLTREEFRQDTRTAIDSIEQVAGQKVDSYRAPAFSITPNNKWALEVLHENGIRYDSSIFPATRDFGGFPSFSEQRPSIVRYNGTEIKEFPIVTTRILGKEIAYAGGGYFRMMPYPLLKSLFANREYVMTYFHIRDFDRLQKRYWTKRYFKDYYGINGAFSKFKKMVEKFDYTDMATANDFTDWDNAPVVQL